MDREQILEIVFNGDETLIQDYEELTPAKKEYRLLCKLMTSEQTISELTELYDNGMDVCL